MRYATEVAPGRGPGTRSDGWEPDLSGYWSVGLLGTEGAEFFGVNGELDSVARPLDSDPAFSGDGVAHSNGDTLVIDTIAIDERVRNGK